MNPNGSSRVHRIVDATLQCK